MTRNNDDPQCEAARQLADQGDTAPADFWACISDNALRTITAPTPLLEILQTPIADCSQDALACQFPDESWALEAESGDGVVGLVVHRAHPDARLLSSFADALERADVVLLAECRNCRGSGLHQGYAERNGVAVVCRDCGGSGARAQSYTPFAERRDREGVLSVMSHNPGVSLGDTTMGVPYSEWRDDPMAVARPGSENRAETCPAWWYQGSRAGVKPDWAECNSAYRFPTCRFFPTKSKCWERFDQERAAQAGDVCRQE